MSNVPDYPASIHRWSVEPGDDEWWVFNGIGESFICDSAQKADVLAHHLNHTGFRWPQQTYVTDRSCEECVATHNAPSGDTL